MTEKILDETYRFKMSKICYLINKLNAKRFLKYI